MSSLSKGDIARRARERLTDWPEVKVGFTIPRLVTFVDGALQRVAREVASSREARELLTPATGFPATLTAGQADLSTIINANAILLDYLDRAEVFMADTSINQFPFQWVSSPGELALPTLSDLMFIHCCLTGTVLQTRNVDGQLNTLNGDILVYANFIPTMTQLPATLEDRLISLVADMALSHTRTAPADKAVA